MDFTHLHVHSHYSLLDGLSKVEEIVDKCIATGMNAVALTDHGNMYGIKDLLDYTKGINKARKADAPGCDRGIFQDILQFGIGHMRLTSC